MVTRNAFSLCDYTHPQWDRLRQKKGVVIAGRISAKEGIAVAKWVSQLGWPLLGDVLSQTGQPLPCADLWLNNPQVKAELKPSRNSDPIWLQFNRQTLITMASELLTANVLGD